MTNEKPDSFDKHEVMDRASIAQRILNDMLDGHPGMTPALNALLETASDAIGELYQEAGANCFDDANARDAARYRWLRAIDSNVCVVVPDAPDDASVPHTEQLDAAIDAAMAQQPTDGGPSK